MRYESGRILGEPTTLYSSEWQPNPDQDPDVAVAAFDVLESTTAHLSHLVKSLHREVTETNNFAAEHGGKTIEEGIVGIATMHRNVPRPLRMVISSTDLFIHPGMLGRPEFRGDRDARKLLVPDNAVKTILDIFEGTGFDRTHLATYNHRAGTQHTLPNGKPDITKIRYTAHLHKFGAGVLPDDSLAILFMDPEESLPRKQKEAGMAITRPSVTNLVGLNLSRQGEVLKYYSGRFDTSSITPYRDAINYESRRNKIGTQKGRHLTNWLLNKMRPDMYEMPAIYAEKDVDMDALCMEEIDAGINTLTLRSKFTPGRIMGRLANGRYPGPEVAQQVRATDIVLDGALYLMCNPQNDPKIKWETFKI